MLLLDARPLLRKLKNSAACSTTTRGTADDYTLCDDNHRSFEPCFCKHDACPGLGAVALPVAGSRTRGSRGGIDVIVSRHRAIRDRSRSPRVDVADASCDFLPVPEPVLREPGFQCGRHCEIVFARRGNSTYSEGQCRGERFDRRVSGCAVARCTSLGSRDLVAGCAAFQPAFHWGFLPARARTPQAVLRAEPAGA